MAMGEAAPRHVQVHLGDPQHVQAPARHDGAGTSVASGDEARGELLKEEGGGASGGVMKVEEAGAKGRGCHGGGEGADATQGSSEGEVEAGAEGEDLGREKSKRPSFPEQGRGRSVRTAHAHAQAHTHKHTQLFASRGAAGSK